jgi:hypothetical protein
MICQHIDLACRQEAHEKAVALGNPAPALPQRKRKGHKWVLDSTDLVEILDWIEESPTLTLKQVVARIQANLSKKVSKSMVERAFKALNMTYKDIVDIPVKWNTKPVLAAHQCFVCDQVHDFIGWPLVFMDESAFNMHVVVHKGCAVWGEPARLSVLPRQKNLTLIAALTQTGLAFHKFVASHGEAKHGVDVDDFWLFLLDLRPHLPEGTVILLDNAPIHMATAVKSTFALLHNDGFEVLFLPPYSPFLNPIEFVFSKIKGHVCQAVFHTKEELCQAITNALLLVSAQDARGWFTFMVCY